MLASITSKIDTISNCTPDIYICGDFNIPHTFTNDTYTQTTSCDNQLLYILTDFMMHLNLNQTIHKPTHKDGNILDFLLTNNPDMVFDYQVTPTIHSDHHMVQVETHMTFDKTCKNFTKSKKTSHNKFDNFNFHSDKINWENIKKDLQNIDWRAILSPISDQDKQYNAFLDKCINVITENHVPSRMSKKSTKIIIPRDRRVLMRKRLKLKKRKPTQKIHQKLIDIELELQESYSNERTNQETTATSKIKSNPKYFYSYAKRFSKHKPKVGPLKDPKTNEMTNDSHKMANILQDQYTSVFTKPLPNYDLPEITENQPTLSNIDFSEQDIIQEIDTLSSNAAAGPDGFPAIFLKQVKSQIAAPLYLIWRNILHKAYKPTFENKFHHTHLQKR